MGKRYTSVAQVRLELPFPLMLPQNAFLCWEPIEGVAAFAPEGCVGTLQWKRTCSFLTPEDIFGETPIHQDPKSFPTESYKQTFKLVTGGEITAFLIHAGPEGGFEEARSYTVANIFLCIAHPGSYEDDGVLERAIAAVNNIIDIYRFFTLDPLPRPVHNKNDHYCSTISTAPVPEDLQELSPRDLLLRVDQLPFGSTIGKDRLHIVGLTDYDDLAGYPLSPDGLKQFHKLTRSEHRLELFHQLIFSAIRRLKRRDGALAVIDAQSAFESTVAFMLKSGLTSVGWTQGRIEKALVYKGSLHLLQPRLEKLDAIAMADAKCTAQPCSTFMGSSSENEWRKNLYNLRNEIVHGGRRELSFEDARQAIVSGLKAIHYLQIMCPKFRSHFMWGGACLELRHIKKSAGRLSRLFEV
jgi:hypothetical protein